MDIVTVVLVSHSFTIQPYYPLLLKSNTKIIMTREEYDLIYSAFRSYGVYMTDAEEVLSEKILDDLFYPEFDKLATDPELVPTISVKLPEITS